VLALPDKERAKVIRERKRLLAERAEAEAGIKAKGRGRKG
jgi:hypothetical protein